MLKNIMTNIRDNKGFYAGLSIGVVVAVTGAIISTPSEAHMIAGSKHVVTQA